MIAYKTDLNTSSYGGGQRRQAVISSVSSQSFKVCLFLLMSRKNTDETGFLLPPFHVWSESKINLRSVHCDIKSGQHISEHSSGEFLTDW